MTQRPDDTARTAFPETVLAARGALAAAPVDRASFERPLSLCDISRCHGACCSDGVPLNPEEARVLSELVEAEAPALVHLGLRPDSLVAMAEPGGSGHTGIRARAPGERSPRHPASVPDTACAMLTADGLCGLQVLAVDRGMHPWFWKPMTCWLHPVAVDETGIRLPPEGVTRERAYRDGGYASVTECSRAGLNARPASHVLAAEIGFLGELIGRDLVSLTEQLA
ncbi:MAG: DUF3109 family protein [Gemmatimonadaceae bacterium]